MDVTPQELRGSEIKEAFRGYHRDEVDNLLERAAVTIEDLNRRVQDSPSRAAEPAVAQFSRDDAETLQRTLLLAQRAADDAIAQAQNQARATVEEAEARAQSLVGEAEASARRLHENERRRLEIEISELIIRRDALRGDADALETYANGYRDRLRSIVETDLAGLTSSIDAAHAAAHDVADTGSTSRGYTEPEAESFTARDESELVRTPGDEPVVSASLDHTSADQAWPPPAPAGEPELAEESYMAESVHDRSPDTEVLDDDAFFASLRDAVRDESPLGPSDDGAMQRPFNDWAPEEQSRRSR